MNIKFEEIPGNPQFKNLTNLRYTRYLILGYAGKEKLHTYWWCKCDCGKIKKVRGNDLKTGKTKSCGCYSSDCTKNKNIKHNMSSSPEYNSYRAAKERCENKNNIAYSMYGGRGIKFNFDSFEDFFKEVGIKPSKKHSVDRIDTNGNYEVGNLRWVTAKEQCNNTRRNHLITIDGVTKSAAEWAESDIAQTSHQNIITRINVLKWCDKCAVTQPKNSVCPHKSNYIPN